MDTANHRELVNAKGYKTLRQVASAGSFEGQSTFGVGVAKKGHVLVQAFDGARGDRIVIDVAHGS